MASSWSWPAPGKRKRDSASTDQGPSQQPSEWRTRRAQETYSSKLLDALRLVRAGGTRGREVRDAADRALAVAARGRSRWSRAILARRRRRARLHRAPQTPAARSACSSSSGSAQPALERKAKVLGLLVPGCRKLPFPALLAEVSDYIAALEMQVRVMSDIAQALSASGGSSTA
ncbi:transcription factor bHLH149-like [Phragmites australis]|uniref:transcription factor bHLH149-like n=1 Tax=Phragmites australis TaxID=29695 RepID=UPI002D787958|nr:transcription factor bHLH149-like [Phragmites australis]